MDTTRRSANYNASIVDDSFLQSLNSPYMAQEYIDEAAKLKEEVKVLIHGTKSLLDRLQLIDHLERLDVSYLFRDEVTKLLDNIYSTVGCRKGIPMKTMDLYATALQFRLLRQHGYHVPQEVFNDFIDDGGNFKTFFANDVKGLLSLYEASFLSMEGESILDQGKDFAVHHLKEILDKIEDSIQAEEVRHALEFPVHWRVQKLEARWFINVYETRSDADPSLLQLAKLNFNMVQAIYQNEIKALSRWYRETGLSEKIGYSKHRMVESFYGALATVPHPHLANSRMIVTKASSILTILDDTYDIYGTADELEVLTETIQRWDINELDNLPEFMKIIFLVLFDTINEVAYDIFRGQGLNVIPYLRKSWAEVCKAFNTEARWYQQGYFPGLKEYLNTASITGAGSLLVFHAYLCSADPINKNELESLAQNPDIIYLPTMLLRLANDLVTATVEKQRGDAPSCIQCYVNETGCSEEEAIKHINQLIDVIWKKMNKEIVMGKEMGLNEGLCASAMNFAKIAQFIYKFGDGFGVSDGETKRNFASIVVEPIPIQRSRKVQKTVCTMAKSVVSARYPIAYRWGSLKKQAIGIRLAPLAQLPWRPHVAAL